MEAPDACCNCSDDDTEMYVRQREREEYAKLYWASPAGILRRKQLDEQKAIEAEARRPKWIQNPDEDYMKRYNLQNKPWINNLRQLCLLLVLLSDRYYVNTDRIDYIDAKEKWIKIGNDGQNAHSHWYLKVTDEDIEKLNAAMGVYK